MFHNSREIRIERKIGEFLSYESFVPRRTLINEVLPDQCPIRKAKELRWIYFWNLLEWRAKIYYTALYSVGTRGISNYDVDDLIM